MSNRARVWILAGCACLAVAAVMLMGRRSGVHGLPAAASYPGLPAAFGARLGAARERATRGSAAPEDVRALARLYQANRLYGEARACYEYLRSRPEGLDARDHYYLAAIEQYGGDLERAEAELRAVVKAEPHYLPARLALTDVLFKSGQADAAEKAYLAVLAIEANQPQAMFGLARIELMRGNDEAAVARLGALMASHPEMTSGAGLLAQVFNRRGETERAALMTQWSRQKPEPVPPDPWMDALLADCYELQTLELKFEEYFTGGDIGRAVPLLGRVEELDPKSPVPHLLRGWTMARDHDDAGAVLEYRKALEGGGDPEKICPYMVQSLLALGQVSGAEKLLAEFYAKKPDSIPILIAYSDVAVRQGDTALARTLLSRVLEKEPYLYAANMNLARILWASGERDEAAKCLERVSKVSATDVPSRALLGEYYLGKSDPDLAIPPLEQALANEHGGTPSYKSLEDMLYGAYLRAGAAREENGHAAEAVAAYYDKAIGLVPADPNGYVRKAGACARLGQFRGAADALEKLGDLQPANPTVFLSLGDVLYQGGDRVQARINWQKARALTAAGDAALRDAIDSRLKGPVTDATFK